MTDELWENPQDSDELRHRTIDLATSYRQPPMRFPCGSRAPEIRPKARGGTGRRTNALRDLYGLFGSAKEDRIQNKLNCVGKPRVHIEYDVENYGAATKKELRFVFGVAGEFSEIRIGVTIPLMFPLGRSFANRASFSPSNWLDKHNAPGRLPT